MLIDMTNNEKADSLASGAANRLFVIVKTPRGLMAFAGQRLNVVVKVFDDLLNAFVSSVADC